MWVDSWQSSTCLDTTSLKFIGSGGDIQLSECKISAKRVRTNLHLDSIEIFYLKKMISSQSFTVSVDKTGPFRGEFIRGRF